MRLRLHTRTENGNIDDWKRLEEEKPSDSGLLHKVSLQCRIKEVWVSQTAGSTSVDEHSAVTVASSASMPNYTSLSTSEPLFSSHHVISVPGIRLVTALQFLPLMKTLYDYHSIEQRRDAKQKN